MTSSFGFFGTPGVTHRLLYQAGSVGSISFIKEGENSSVEECEPSVMKVEEAQAEGSDTELYCASSIDLPIDTCGVFAYISRGRSPGVRYIPEHERGGGLLLLSLSCWAKGREVQRLSL